jgi:23S rRNA (uracil1939-C5)-methyltransferase
MKRGSVIASLGIEGLEIRGKGVAREEGLVVFVPDTVPGDVVDVRVTKKRSSYLEGRVIDYRVRSAERVEPFCIHFDNCGGCKWQHLPYERQLAYKEGFVRDAIGRLGKLAVETFLPIRPCSTDRRYRNKLEFSFASTRWITEEEVNAGGEIEDRRALGLHVPGRFDRVIDILECHLQPEPSNLIRNTARDLAKELGMSFYDPVNHTGMLRNLMIRTTTAGEVMVVVIFGDVRPEQRDAYLDELGARLSDVDSFSYIENRSKNDSLAGHEAVPVRGRAYITESLDGLEFRIYPTSFFQTNPEQTRTLYDIVRDWAELDAGDLVYDLYCGAGSISLYLARDCRLVVGVESVEQAVRSARENAELNGMHNAEFIVGSVESVLCDSFFEQRGKPSLVVLDPPRAGLHPDVVDQLISARPDRIIYVSCNPSTQARDLGLLAEHYRVKRLQPVDMFPQTYHIESVAELSLL